MVLRARWCSGSGGAEGVIPEYFYFVEIKFTEVFDGASCRRVILKPAQKGFDRMGTGEKIICCVKKQ